MPGPVSQKSGEKLRSIIFQILARPETLPKSLRIIKLTSFVLKIIEHHLSRDILFEKR